MTFMNLLRRSIGTARAKRQPTDIADGPPKSYSEGTTTDPSLTNSVDDENSIREVKLLREWKEQDPAQIPGVSHMKKVTVRLKPSSPSAVSDFPAGSNSISEFELPQAQNLNYKYDLNINADLLNEEEEEENFENEEESIDSSRYSWSMSGMSSVEKIIHHKAMPLIYEDNLSSSKQKSISLPKIRACKYHLLNDGDEEARLEKEEERIVNSRYSWRKKIEKIINRNVMPLKDDSDTWKQESIPFITSCGFRTENERNDKKYRNDITACRLLRQSHSRCSNRCDLNMEHYSQSSDILRQDTNRHRGTAEEEEFDLASNAYDSSRVSSITSSTGDNLKMKNRILRRETEGTFQPMDGHTQIPSLITTRKSEN